MLDFMRNMGEMKKAGDEAQRTFTPEWLLRTAAAQAKKFFLDALARDVSVAELAQDWDRPEDETRLLLTKLWDHLRRK